MEKYTTFMDLETIVKMLTFHEFIYRLKLILVSVSFNVIGIDKLILKFVWKAKTLEQSE